MEIWKDIPGYDGYYQASNNGKIRGLTRVIYGKRKKTVYGRELVPVKYKNGYLGVQLCKETTIRISIHRLVCMAFYGVPDSRLHVDHIDYDRT